MSVAVRPRTDVASCTPSASCSVWLSATSRSSGTAQSAHGPRLSVNSRSDHPVRRLTTKRASAEQNSLVYSGSRSTSKYRLSAKNPSSVSSRFRDLLHPRALGVDVIPPISTLRVARSIKKNTWYRTSPAIETTSTVKKSAGERAGRPTRATRWNPQLLQAARSANLDLSRYRDRHQEIHPRSHSPGQDMGQEPAQPFSSLADGSIVLAQGMGVRPGGAQRVREPDDRVVLLPQRRPVRGLDHPEQSLRRFVRHGCPVLERNSCRRRILGMECTSQATQSRRRFCGDKRGSARQARPP